MSSDVIALLGTTLRITNNGVELRVATPYSVIAVPAVWTPQTAARQSPLE